MKKLFVVIAVAVPGCVNNIGFSQTEFVNYKTGDNDARFTIGLLQTLFTDSLIRYEFGSVDPSIFKLNVLDEYGEPIDNFRNWISKLNISEYTSDKYDILYSGPTEYVNSESITIVNKYTRDFIRMITIAYSDFDITNNRYTNVISITDFIIK